jgi:hypothetical protein
MAHQALQHLQRNTGVKHVHGIGVTERVRRHWYGECNVIGRSGFDRFIQPGPDRPIGDLPDACLFILPVCLFLRSSGIFRVATIISSWLTYWLSDSGTRRCA